jgi:hypothetical protein
MRATEAMHYGKHGWNADDEEKYTHLDISDPKTRAEMTKARREAKKEEKLLFEGL